VESLIVRVFLHKGLEGSALPAQAGDNLDVTTTSSSSSSFQQDAKSPKFAKPEDAGLGMMAKFFYLTLVVAVCVVFVKTRKNGGNGWKGSKSTLA
jgi:hypothetical protein